MQRRTLVRSAAAAAVAAAVLSLQPLAALAQGKYPDRAVRTPPPKGGSCQDWSLIAAAQCGRQGLLQPIANWLLNVM